MTLDQLYTEPRFKIMSLDKLSHIIGNELSFEDYNKMKGGDSKIKADNLHKKFKDAINYDKVYQPKNSWYNSKNYIIPLDFIDKENKIVTLTVDYLVPKVERKLYSNKRPLHSICMDDISQRYHPRINQFIEEGYSILFIYKLDKHILIYNA